jgi:hypothetical protein
MLNLRYSVAFDSGARGIKSVGFHVVATCSSASLK